MKTLSDLDAVRKAALKCAEVYVSNMQKNPEDMD